VQSLAHYRKQAEDLVKRRKSGDSAALRLADAQRFIAREEHFDNWPKLAKHIQALRRTTSTVSRFEAAVEAVIKGDLPTLKRLLREHPKLIRERSTRQHRSTLLIYVGANGVEGYRQKTPKNAVKVAETLLNAGAEIDAVGKMYRGTTTLGLVATSVHPYLAGVQDDLMDLLLKRGASLEIAVARDYTNGSVVNACLANGRPEAAEFLAKRGARLDLDGAAGVGRLDVVESFFNKDGSLRATATRKQMTDGFNWACGCGRTAVVDFLLKHGMDVAAPLGRSGTTGLHCAAYGGHVDTVRLLLERKAPVDAIEREWNNTPLGWALHSWSESRTRADREPYYQVVAMLVAAGATVRPAVLEWSKVRADRRMLSALTTRSR